MTEIKSRRNPLIVHMKKLGADGDYRRESGEFLCDGEKLLREAIQSDAEIKAVLTSGNRPSYLPESVQVCKVGQDIIDSVSPLKNPQNIIFSCAIPQLVGRDARWLAKRDIIPPSSGPVIILEGIQDPGNIGTILRTASAFNIGCVILTGGCADPYNPKTIRATMGAIFRQRILATDFAGIRELKTAGFRLYGAALTRDSRDIREVSLENAAVVIGSEGQGLSAQMLALCDEKIIIPMAPDSESLNAAVAAAIVMWEGNKGSLSKAPRHARNLWEYVTEGD